MLRGFARSLGVGGPVLFAYFAADIAPFREMRNRRFDRMKALTYHPRQDAFFIADLPLPEPAAMDVLVNVEATSLNPVDAKIGLWKSRVPGMPDTWVPGLDVAGRIAAVGSEVRDWKIGDRVLYHGDMLRPHGGFAEYAIHDARTLTPHPDLPAAEAAATPCAGWTAWRSLHDTLHAGEGDSILITGGSGGVGGFAIQIARYAGVHPIIATCSGRNRDYVLSLGATHVVDHTREDIHRRVLDITGARGVTIGLDAVGGENDIIVANALAEGGRMVELVRGLRPERYRDAVQRKLELHQLSLGAGHRGGDIERAVLVAAGRAFSRLVEQGHISLTALRTVSLEEVGPSLVRMLEQRTVGKIVMTASLDSPVGFARDDES